jgi:pimeloyl-ACP methyl ester carboxylesterase
VSDQHRAVFRRLAGVACCGLLLATALSGTPAAAAPAAPGGTCASGSVQQVTGGGTAQGLKGSVPVLFVHGMNSTAGVWAGQSPSSLAGQVAQLQGMTAWTFDYRHESLDWVSNSAVGPALASAIQCLAGQSGHSVIIVAHSLGGLAAQYAIGQPGVGTADVAELITIGTPYTGSLVLSVAEAVANGGIAESIDNPTAAFVEAALSACAGIATHTDTNPCWLASVIRAPIGTALESGSSAIARLPAWPSSLPVLDVAGNVDVFIGVGRFGVHVHPGDGAVMLPSATAHHTAGTFVVSCNAGNVISLFTGPCFHTHLPHNGQVIARILAAIKGDQPLAPGTYPVNRVIDNYDGWLVTLASVQVSQNGTATFYVTNQNVSAGSPGTLTCTGVTDPNVSELTLGDGQVVDSTATFCSENPGDSTITVQSGQSTTDFAVFPDSAGLTSPFSFTWQVGVDLTGTVSGITLGGH